MMGDCFGEVMEALCTNRGDGEVRGGQGSLLYEQG